MKKTALKAFQETSQPRSWTTQPKSREAEVDIRPNNFRVGVTKNNKETKMYSYNFYLLKNQRYLRRDSVLRLFQEPRRELPITLLNLWPLRIPRFLRPAAVKPRSSRCLWTGLQIQLILGSRRTALWNGSTIITSKYLYVESWATQYELSTLKLPQYRPARSWRKEDFIGFCSTPFFFLLSASLVTKVRKYQTLLIYFNKNGMIVV